MRKEWEEEMAEDSVVEAWCIVLDKVEKKSFPLSCLEKNDCGYYYVDNYGMGACHWSVVYSPEEAYHRQLKDDVAWAKDRLVWARENDSDEVEWLQEIIDSNGFTRNPAKLKSLKKYMKKESEA